MSNFLARGQEKFINPLGNYTKDQSIDDLQYQTGQNVNGQKRAADTVVYGTFQVSTLNPIAVGSTNRVLKKISHNARKNDVVHFTSGNNSSTAIQILSCPDADTIILAATPEFSLVVGDTFDIKRYISPQYAEDGSLSVSVNPLPIRITVDGVSTEVGIDTIAPANTVSVPVRLESATGPINITAGDLNVQLSDIGANADVTRIGDGTNRLGINSNLEAKVHDADLLAEALVIDTSINTLLKPASTLNKVLTVDTITNAVTAKIQDSAGSSITLGQQVASESLPVVLTAAQLSTLTPSAAITGFALETTQSAQAALFGPVTETAPATDTASSGLNGRLQRIAQNLTTILGKLPTIGPQTGAASLSITPATDAKFSIKPSATTSTYAENLALTTVTTITAPANAVGVLVMCDDANANNIRVKQNGAASVTSGFPLQAGRDLKFDCGTDLSVISDNAGVAGASVKVYFNWYIQA
jgi:hypothetical protein